MDSRVKLQNGKPGNDCYAVSILVLMDSRVKTVEHLKKDIDLDKCFNPCFNG